MATILLTVMTVLFLANKNPKWVLGWSNTFNYKGLELGIELNGRFGYIVDTGGERPKTVCITNVK